MTAPLNHALQHTVVGSRGCHRRASWPPRVRTVATFAAVVLSLTTATECLAVTDSFHAQEFVPHRVAALWLLFGSVALTAVAFIAAFILSAFPRTYHMSRWAMTFAKVFGLLAVAGLAIGVMFTILMIIDR